MEFRSRRSLRHAIAGRRLRSLCDRQRVFAGQARASSNRRRYREDGGLRRPRATWPSRLHCGRCPHDAAPGCAHRHHRGPATTGRVSRPPHVLHRTRSQRPVAGLDGTGQLRLHGLVRWRLPWSEPGGDARRAARRDRDVEGCTHAALRSSCERMVFGRPAPSRRPGRRRHAAGIPGALATRRRTRSAVRQ